MIMMKIAALTPGTNVASSRFRVRQYIPKLYDNGIEVVEFPAKINYSAKLPGILGRVKQKYIFPLSATLIGIKALSRAGDIIRSKPFDAVWINRIITNPLFLEKYIRPPLIYDIDDAIWINNEKIIGKIASKAEVILAGNDFIAENLEKYNSNIKVIPTAIDILRFQPIESKADDLFNIVWTGSKDTVHYLKSIEKPLSDFLNNVKNSRLTVISDILPAFNQIKHDKVKFVSWSAENEVQDIQEADLGIMPLFDTKWEKGKCSYKMLQYMACGLPVIVSPVGMNKEVLSKGNIGLPATKDKEWLEGINFLYKNRTISRRMGMEGTRVVKENYSLSIISGKLIEVFNSL